MDVNAWNKILMQLKNANYSLPNRWKHPTAHMKCEENAIRLKIITFSLDTLIKIETIFHLKYTSFKWLAN